MSILNEIRARLPVPVDFGAEAPYARFSRVEVLRDGGEDITLEYRAAEVPGDKDLIVFSHSEWRANRESVATRPVYTVTLDVETGEPGVASQDLRAELRSAIRSALLFADQMSLVPVGAAAAA